jgi:SAM-dependent methyltransferase
MLDILRTVKSLVFGRARRCPVCERNAVSFLPLPDYYREQADKYGYKYFGKGETINIREYSCNHCGASDRERLSALFLESVIRREGFVSGSKLLHFAPEVALAKRIRQSGKFDYRSADISMEGVSDNVDISDMACYGDAVFDAFICSHVLEHVQDDHAALCELHRILKPGGWGILMSPLMTEFEESLEDPGVTAEADRWRLFGQGDHVRLYAKKDFLKRITQAGFSVRQLGMDFFGSGIFHQCGITPGSVLYVVSHD